MEDETAEGTCTHHEDDRDDRGDKAPEASQHHTLKYHLLGPSLTKAGQDTVDQKKVSEIIYNASKGSKYFNNEESKDYNLTIKIDRILAKKRQLEKLDLKHDLRKADDYIAQLELTRDLSQAVVHIDCDAFYAAVEELDRPELKDVPFAVGKGVLTTCNYHARKFGCRSGMAGFVADKLCPQLIHIPLNFEKYTAKAREVRAVLSKYDPRFESASIDEAYMNISEYCHEHSMQPEDAVRQMREEVHSSCKITISAGIAANTKLAKICSNMNKPNGQFRLPSDRNAIIAFMRDLPTRKVNGIGRVFERELDAIGIKTCGDIYGQRRYLSKLFGDKAFEFLMGVYLGLGRTNVQPAEEYERKSVGTESTFKDMSDPAELREKLRWIADELEKDCERTQFKGRTLVLKIKLHTYEVFTRQVAPPKAVHRADDLYKYALPMLVKLMGEIPEFKLRLMGLRLTHLVSMRKPSPSFFGRRAGGAAAAKGIKGVDVDDEGWQRWPDEEFEDAARQERDEELQALEELSQEHDARDKSTKPADDEERRAFEERKHDNGFAWRALLEEERANCRALNKTNLSQLPSGGDDGTAIMRRTGRPADGEEEVWDCPVCGLAQKAEERAFNAHIDACLSRGAIKEVLQTEEPTEPRRTGIPTKSNGAATGRKRKAAVEEGKRRRPFFT
ncbi:DNA polymerase kappa [Sphaceloma murrayae]|uniref:DNA polymerase kappa n=1 Tax=Sphaceloma murrayae TaxID=2082308 RepID=A0A2K1QGC1_9PEZI|nr:DNA polymerase kappa [Sphaceloma murrayae]